MNEGWKKWLIKSAGFGAGFALTLGAVAGVAAWYVFRPKPPKPPSPWNRTAIRAEFVKAEPNRQANAMNLVYILTNTADDDYTIDRVEEVRTAGLDKGDVLLGLNNAFSFDAPLMVPARRKTQAILHVFLGNGEDATNVNDFLQMFSTWKGFAILDEKTRYEIDFPLLDASSGVGNDNFRENAYQDKKLLGSAQTASDATVSVFLSLSDDQKNQVLAKLSPEAKQALLKGIKARVPISPTKTKP